MKERLKNCNLCKKDYLGKVSDLCSECQTRKYRAKVRENRAAIIKALAELKSVPCTDCNKTYPSYVMDFDHLFDKEFSISQMNRSVSNYDMILEEVKKCEVVCSNCHRRRTYKRLNNV